MSVTRSRKRTTNSRSTIKSLNSALAKMTDEELLKELERARRESGEIVRSGPELVALRDALRACSGLVEGRVADRQARIAELQNDREQFEIEIEHLRADDRELNAELDRLQKEVNQRFGDWSAAEENKPLTR